MVIGALRIEIYIDGNRSLKGKRQTLRSVIGRVKSRFGNVSISEVDSQNLWQKATIGVSFVSNDAPYVNSVMDQVSGFIESMGVVQIVSCDLEIIHC
ncbi:MAG TPA: DUF503 domain-containing protein [Thermodesulfobacteriota bacterium]|jgi:uncharacterized protein YlxP (DUF503 family)